GARIAAMRKPTMAAWWANQLSRREAPAIDDLLGLGDQLRAATAALDGARLRELSPRRHVLVEALLDRAREHAGSAGVRLSDKVAGKLRETLDAAIVDVAAGEAARTGRLVHALRHVGFGVVDETGEPADVVSLTDARAAREKEPKPAGEPAAVRVERQFVKQRRAEAEVRLAATQAAVTSADSMVDELAERHREGERVVESLKSLVTRLTAELAAAGDELERARSTAQLAERALSDARNQARSAREEVHIAHQDLDRVDDA
ncbi:MAG: hypothetical protein ACRDVZ_11740, partial [Jiangellaceae bacterium]